jgi:hypothetical protein
LDRNVIPQFFLRHRIEDVDLIYIAQDADRWLVTMSM